MTAPNDVAALVERARAAVRTWHGISTIAGADLVRDLADMIDHMCAARSTQAATIAALQAKLEQREERLEITHHWVVAADGDDLVREDIPAEERDDMPDGIECRDATIDLLEKRTAELSARVAALQAEVERANEALAAVEQHERSNFIGDPLDKARRASWRGVMRKVRSASRKETTP